jgi:hypothetical protein
MAKAAWKRPGSPIGRKGPRKTDPKYKRRSGERDNAGSQPTQDARQRKHTDWRHQFEA